MLKASSAVLLALFVIGVGLWLGTRAKPSQKQEFKTTEELVSFLAKSAVEDAAQNSAVNLDYSVDSIKVVEQILGNLHDQYTKHPSSISPRGLSSAYGAYIGEVIRKSEPGAYWLRDDETGEKSYPLVWGPGEGHSYPMGWCYKRIVDGPEDNVWFKYRAIKDGLTRNFQTAAPKNHP